MTDKRFITNRYKIYDTFHDGEHWLVNEVEAEEIVTQMNNLDTKARERSKALSKLQKENEQLKFQLNDCLNHKLFSRRELEKENEQLKSDLARVIEQARKNNELYVSDITILEKALWCSGCENDYGRLRQLRKEFLK